MLRIGVTDDGKLKRLGDTAPLPTELYDGDITITRCAQERLRVLLGIPELTPEPWAEAERVLEQAVAEGVLLSWSYSKHSKDFPGYYGVQWPDTSASGGRGCEHCGGDTRLITAQAAVVRVLELRAEAEAKKSEPEGMSIDLCELALLRGGWRIATGRASSRPRWERVDRPQTGVTMDAYENLLCFYRRAVRALRRAREVYQF